MPAALGVTPETFSRLLKRLALDGDIIWSARQIKVSPRVWAWLSQPRKAKCAAFSKW